MSEKISSDPLAEARAETDILVSDIRRGVEELFMSLEGADYEATIAESTLNMYADSIVRILTDARSGLAETRNGFKSFQKTTGSGGDIGVVQ